MPALYNLIIRAVAFLCVLAAFFNRKARALVSGQRGLLRAIEQVTEAGTAPVIWIHCASLGEFEQGRPLIELLKKEYGHFKILLTFYSPSGYEVRKNYEQADWVFYLPWDTPSNARRFVEVVKPRVSIFVKYEFWFNYTTALQRNAIPIFSISSIFRKQQIFFRATGGFFRRILGRFTHFYVQDEASKKLLHSIGITSCTVSGDTRFDRVRDIALQLADLPEAVRFKGQQRVMVVGSSWPDDMRVLLPFINSHTYQLKFIIAPHEVDEERLREIEKKLQVKYMRLSHYRQASPDDCQVLLIDSVGLLATLYRHGEYAYVGGAFGAGLHNILEPACYGVPIFFGNKNFKKFREARDMLQRGAAFTIRDTEDLQAKYEMINIPENFLAASEAAREYVDENVGATQLIMAGLRPFLS